MKLSRVIVLGVALLAGGIAAFLALNLTAPEPVEPQLIEREVRVDSTQVLVATADIPMGTKLSSGSVEWMDWPKTGVSGRFIVRSGSGDEQMAEVDGAIARSTFYAGEPISDAKLIRADQGFMSAILPQGKRAVATKITADTSAGGFILPNDRVDVIMSRDAPEGNGKFITETILNNVRVLAIDQTIEDVDGTKVVVGQTATLELSPQQAEILSVAQRMSDRLTLALRSIADGEAGASDAARDAVHLLGGSREEGGSVTVVKSGIAKEVDSIR